jgi:pilus assembly protein CpaE
MSVTGTQNRVAIVGVCLDAQSYKAVSHYIMAVSGSMMAGNVERYVGAEREAVRALEKAQHQICIVDFDQNPDEAMWVAERLRSESPEIFVFAASAYPDPDRIIAAMRAGCAEYLVKPLQSDRLLEGIARVEAKQKDRGRSKVRGKVITMVGAKGGTGVTSISIHLALHLAGERRKALLVDQHPALGDSSLYLGTGRHQYSFYELASNTDRLDEELLQGFLLQHESGLQLLDSPERVDAPHYAPPAAIEHTLSFLAESYQYVVVDCPPGLSDATLACIAQSDQVAIVMTAELPSVRNAVRYMEYLSKLGYNAANIRIILNRHSKKGPLTDEKVEKALQHQIDLKVPNSYNEVIRAINAGTPITAEDKSDFSLALDTWARELVGRTTAKQAATGARSGMLGLFSR